MDALLKNSKHLFIAFLVLFFAILLVTLAGFIGVTSPMIDFLEDDLFELVVIVLYVAVPIVVIISLFYSLFLPFAAFALRRRGEGVFATPRVWLLFVPHVQTLVLTILWWFQDSFMTGERNFSCSIADSREFYGDHFTIFQFAGYGTLYVSVILFIGVLVYAVFRYIRVKDRLALLTAGSLLLYAVSILIVAIVFTSFLHTARRKSRDARRISDIKQVQLAAELYWDVVPDSDGAWSYPIVSGRTAQERWSGLELMLAPKFIPRLPDDPCGPGEHQYDYKNSPDGTSYIMRAILDNSDNPALIEGAGDLDYDQMGIWCGEEGQEFEYCVSP